MLNPDFRDILSAFSDADVDYLVVGAYAMAAHDLPRATGDIDLWVRASAGNARRVLRALAAFGAPLDGVTAEDFSGPDVVFHIGLPPRRIDLLTSVDGVTFDEAWGERLTLRLGG